MIRQLHTYGGGIYPPCCHSNTLIQTMKTERKGRRKFQDSSFCNISFCLFALIPNESLFSYFYLSISCLSSTLDKFPNACPFVACVPKSPDPKVPRAAPDSRGGGAQRSPGALQPAPQPLPFPCGSCQPSRLLANQVPPAFLSLTQARDLDGLGKIQVWINLCSEESKAAVRWHKGWEKLPTVYPRFDAVF